MRENNCKTRWRWI